MDWLNFSKVNVSEESKAFLHLWNPPSAIFPRDSSHWMSRQENLRVLTHSSPQASWTHCHNKYIAHKAQVCLCSMCISIWSTYCHEQFLHTVRGHTVQMGQMKLEMHFVAEDILAEGAADNRLHWVLWQDMHLDTIWVPTIVVTIRTLIELKKNQVKMQAISQCAFYNLLI